MAQSRKQFVESHGATCKNWRWSWSFVNEKEKFVIFGAWADRDMRLDENTYMILNEEWERGRTGRKQAAYRRAKDHIRLVEEKGYRLKTFLMFRAGKRSDTGPSKIKKFIPELTEKLLIKSGNSWYATDDTSIKSVSDFHKKLKELKDEKGSVYRGQADADWQVNCSAYRRLTDKPSREIEHQLIEHLLVGYLEFLIGKARMRGFIPQDLNDRCTDLELLAHLQHQGAATGLIDFTVQPLVALWFACDESQNEDGAVFALPRSETEEINERDNLKEAINSFYGKREILLWQPSAIGNRIVAQGSVFLFGVSIIESSEMKKFVIKSNNKKVIREELETVYGINEEALFSDFSGYAIANAEDKKFDVEYAIRYWKRQVDLISRSKDKNDETKVKKADAYFNCGVAYSAIREYEEAIKQYDNAIKEYESVSLPDKYKTSNAYNHLGIANYKLGKNEEKAGEDDKAKNYCYKAIVAYDEALQHDQYNLNAYFNRGAARAMLGQHREAIKDYTEVAKSIVPNYLSAYYYRGISQLCLGEWGEAQKDLAIVSKRELSYIVKTFRKQYTDIKTFEKKYNVTLPPEIVALLTPDKDKP